MKRSTVYVLCAILLGIAVIVSINRGFAHAQFPPPITGPVIPSDVYVFNVHGQTLNIAAVKDSPFVFTGYMDFQLLGTTASGGTSIVTGVVGGHGRTRSGAGTISGVWRQEVDTAGHLTGAILITFGCGQEQFEWLAYFSPQGGSVIDRSIYRAVEGRFER